MGTTRNIDFRSKEQYEEVQRQANLNTNGSCSAFVRLAVSQFEELNAEVITLEKKLRDANREIRRLKADLEKHE
jgi:hypothetical protein